MYTLHEQITAIGGVSIPGRILVSQELLKASYIGSLICNQKPATRFHSIQKSS